MNPNLLIFSHATYVGASGATAAATYKFFSKEYKPPAQPRYIAVDVVKNQNGKFKYIYDNGPGFRQWSPFSILCEDKFQSVIGVGATVQKARLEALWEHPGLLGMTTPDGTYQVHWSDNSLEQNFRIFPKQTGDTIEYEIVIQLEEG